MPSARHVRAKEIVSVKKITNFLLDSTILFNFMSRTHPQQRNAECVRWWLCSRRCPTILYNVHHSRLASLHRRQAPMCTTPASASPFTCSDAISNNTHTHSAFFASHLMIWGIYFDSFITGSAAESDRTDPVPYVLSLYEYGTLGDTFHSRREQKW